MDLQVRFGRERRAKVERHLSFTFVTHVSVENDLR